MVPPQKKSWTGNGHSHCHRCNIPTQNCIFCCFFFWCENFPIETFYTELKRCFSHLYNNHVRTMILVVRLATSPLSTDWLVHWPLGVQTITFFNWPDGEQRGYWYWTLKQKPVWGCSCAFFYRHWSARNFSGCLTRVTPLMLTPLCYWNLLPFFWS